MAQTPITDPHLSRSKRTGILVLTALLFILLIVWYCLPLWIRPASDAEDRKLQAAWEQFRSQQTLAGSETDATAGVDAEQPAATETPARLFIFDPNTASEQELTALGLPPGTARTLIKYRSHGGKFYKAEDLRRLYTLKPADYARIVPYVRIAGATGRSYGRDAYAHDDKASATAAPVVVELNGADAAALIRLKGIGPTFARRIIGYRDALGGFVQVEQLKEVYGLPDSVYRQCLPMLRADGRLVKLINVNTATEEELARHPYIRKGLASGIIRLRNDLKSFREIAQIRQVPLINDEKYRKIAPYLSTN